MSSTKRSAKNPLLVWLRNSFGDLNSSEKKFLYAFILSIALGIVYGLLDQSIAEIAIRYLPPLVTLTPFWIFSHNFLVAVMAAATGGIGILVSNFLTYAAVSGMFVLRASHRLPSHPMPSVVVAILGVVGGAIVILFEMSAYFCFAISGFTILERLWKRKTRLRRGRLMMAGTILLSVAAVLEWSVGILTHG